MYAYYLVHTSTGDPPYDIGLYNHKGVRAGTAPSIEYAQEWVKKWNCSNLPKPYTDEYRNKIMLAYKLKDLEVEYEWLGVLRKIPLIEASFLSGDAIIIDVNLAPTTTCTSTPPVPCQEEPKGNNPMYIDDCQYNTFVKQAYSPKTSATATNVVVELKAEAKSDGVADMRKHLLIRVNTLRHAKFCEIAEQFHRYEPASPKTIKDLKERLKKGLYTVDVPKGYDEEDEDEDFYWRDLFSWRTEDTKFDKDGYNAASAELTEFLQSLEDKIKILDPKDTLSLLDDLKKWKPSKAKK